MATTKCIPISNVKHKMTTDGEHDDTKKNVFQPTLKAHSIRNGVIPQSGQRDHLAIGGNESMVNNSSTSFVKHHIRNECNPRNTYLFVVFSLVRSRIEETLKHKGSDNFHTRMSEVFVALSVTSFKKICSGVKRSVMASKDMLWCQKICYGVRRYVYVPRNVPFCYRVTKVVFYTFYVYFSSDPMKSITLIESNN